MLGCLDDDVAAGVEAGAPRPSGDLVELASGEVTLLGSVELHQRGHDHRADRYVDPHPERVRSADDGQQPFAGQSLHQPPVTWQHARVMHADPGAQQPRERGPETTAEAEVAECLHHLGLAGPGHQVHAQQGGGPLHRLLLGEVDDVDRCLVLPHQALKQLTDRLDDVLHLQGDRPHGVVDDGDLAARALAQVPHEEGDVAQRGRQQHHLRLGQLQEGHLPGPSALRVGVVVELVHDDAVHVHVLALAQGLISQDLRGAADDRGGGVDGGVPGDHADVVRPEQAHQLEELLTDQGLERRRVVRASPTGQGDGVGGQRDHRLARTRRGGGNDVAALQDLRERLVLVRVEGTASRLRPVRERQVDLLGLGDALGIVSRDEGVEHRVEGRSGLGGHGVIVS